MYGGSQFKFQPSREMLLESNLGRDLAKLNGYLQLLEDRVETQIEIGSDFCARVNDGLGALSFIRQTNNGPHQGYSSTSRNLNFWADPEKPESHLKLDFHNSGAVEIHVGGALFYCTNAPFPSHPGKRALAVRELIPHISTIVNIVETASPIVSREIIGEWTIDSASERPTSSQQRQILEESRPFVIDEGWLDAMFGDELPKNMRK